MKTLWPLILVFLLPVGTLGLQCIKGVSVFGQTYGAKETCKAGASCFFGSATFSPLVTVELTSCSKYRCKGIGSNKCGNVTILGVDVIACCCNDADFCKPPKKGFKDRVKDGFGKLKGLWKTFDLPWKN